MFPVYISGDHVLIFRKINYKKDEVVVFKKEGKNYIKRIKRNVGNKYFVGGDNQKESVKEFVVGKKDIIGKVIFKY
jgi:phage repressor protein C with HTH and peptisase S24 domain